MALSKSDADSAGSDLQRNLLAGPGLFVGDGPNLGSLLWGKSEDHKKNIFAKLQRKRDR